MADLTWAQKRRLNQLQRKALKGQINASESYELQRLVLQESGGSLDCREIDYGS